MKKLLIITLTLFACAAPALAAEDELTLEQLLKQVEQNRFEESRANQKREENFTRKKKPADKAALSSQSRTQKTRSPR